MRSKFTFIAALLVSLTQAFNEETMICIVNQVRANYGLQPLGMDSRLTSAAQKHSEWMSSKKTMSHTGNGGSSPSDRITASGVKWSEVGENISYGYKDEQAAMDSWMKSPGHRENILGSQFCIIGCAGAGSGTVYYTQDFAKDASTSLKYPNCGGSKNTQQDVSNAVQDVVSGTPKPVKDFQNDGQQPGSKGKKGQKDGQQPGGKDKKVQKDGQQPDSQGKKGQQGQQGSDCEEGKKGGGPPGTPIPVNFPGGNPQGGPSGTPIPLPPGATPWSVGGPPGGKQGGNGGPSGTPIPLPPGATPWSVGGPPSKTDFPESTPPTISDAAKTTSGGDAKATTAGSQPPNGQFLVNDEQLLNLIKSLMKGIQLTDGSDLIVQQVPGPNGGPPILKMSQSKPATHT